MIVLANERTKVVIYPVTAKSLVEIFAFCGVAIMNFAFKILLSGNQSGLRELLVPTNPP